MKPVYEITISEIITFNMNCYKMYVQIFYSKKVYFIVIYILNFTLRK